MSKQKPDNIVYSDEQGYNASLLPYATNVGAPVIKTDDVVAWKSRGIHSVNKEFENLHRIINVNKNFPQKFA